MCTRRGLSTPTRRCIGLPCHAAFTSIQLPVVWPHRYQILICYLYVLCLISRCIVWLCLDDKRGGCNTILSFAELCFRDLVECTASFCTQVSSALWFWTCVSCCLLHLAVQCRFQTSVHGLVPSGIYLKWNSFTRCLKGTKRTCPLIVHS
jgi:hypothetical protein